MNWQERDRHLVRHHGFDETLVDQFDSHDARQAHRNEHRRHTGHDHPEGY